LKFDQLAGLLRAGLPPSTAIDRLGLRGEEHFELIEFSLATGAGLTETAELLSSIEDIEEQTRSEIAQAQQIPQSTKQLMLWLPWVGLAIAELAGLGAVESILSPAGLVLAAAAIGLSYLGSRTSDRMIKRATALMGKPDQRAMRLAIVLESGVSLKEALQISGLTRDDELIRFAIETGVSLRALIQVQLRTDLLKWRTQCLNLARALSVRLMLPLGLTTLPAFLLLTVAPILLGALSKGET
jgi:tight adherence protein B